MGMYDTVTFDKPPTDKPPFHETTEFQTKQLGRRLDYYRVTEDGELIYEKPTDPDGLVENPWPPEGYVMRRKFTGSMRLIGGESSGFNEIEAVFKDGWLQYICL